MEVACIICTFFNNTLYRVSQAKLVIGDNMKNQSVSLFLDKNTLNKFVKYLILNLFCVFIRNQ